MSDSGKWLTEILQSNCKPGKFSELGNLPEFTSLTEPYGMYGMYLLVSQQDPFPSCKGKGTPKDKFDKFLKFPQLLATKNYFCSF